MQLAKTTANQCNTNEDERMTYNARKRSAKAAAARQRLQRSIMAAAMDAADKEDRKTRTPTQDDRNDK
ncbi:hypothetical protein ACU8OG_24115 [Rhizobium leguminosarum]